MWIVEAGAGGGVAQIGVVAMKVESDELIPDIPGDIIN